MDRELRAQERTKVVVRLQPRTDMGPASVHTPDVQRGAVAVGRGSGPTLMDLISGYCRRRWNEVQYSW